MADRWEDGNRSDYRGDRGYRNRERYDRGAMDRAGDEVRSWFGDDEAARRRRMDELRDERPDRDWDRPGSRPAYGEGAAWVNSGSRMSRDRSDYWNRERNFGDTSRDATADPERTTGYDPYSGVRREWHGTNYSGRGPRGYQRSDERIREDVCDRLTDDPRIDASDVEVHVKNGEVTLAGGVRTREQKRFTEDLVERLTGVREVNNQLKVRPADEVLGTARSGASSVLGLTDTPPPAPSRETK